MKAILGPVIAFIILLVATLFDTLWLHKRQLCMTVPQMPAWDGLLPCYRDKAKNDMPSVWQYSMFVAEPAIALNGDTHRMSVEVACGPNGKFYTQAEEPGRWSIVPEQDVRSCSWLLGCECLDWDREASLHIDHRWDE